MSSPMPRTAHRPRRPHRLLLACLAGGALAGCAYIPSAGPLTRDVEDEYDASAAQHPFVLDEVSDKTIQVLSQRVDPSLSALAGSDAEAPEIQIGRGDTLVVTIWEAGSQPLFAPLAAGQSAGAARGAVLPEQPVGADGCISIPFAGRVPVAGLSLPAAQAAVEAALKGKAAQAQVVLSLARSVAGSVTVVGEVNAGGRIPLTAHGDRVLDVLAASGGIRAPTYETWVGVSRGGVTTSVPLVQVLHDARENIVMRPGDQLLLTRQPETFTAFGATGRNAQIAFEAAQVNLLEAVAKSGGLLDQRADPRGVFLLRQEPRAIAQALAGAQAIPGPAPTVPVIYQLDLRRAGSFFLARDFRLRDGDVLYVSSAVADQLQKFLQLVGLITQPAIEGAVLKTTIH
jgi:polysaccharide export outer membrane protein